MALLQCCFESADYVELMEIEEPEDRKVTRTLSLFVQEKIRPPRRLPEIICALTVTLLSMAIGAALGQRLWLILRIRTSTWCEDAPTVSDLGFDAAHLGRAFHACYCSHLRKEPSMEAIAGAFMAVVCGPLALRLTFGTHYFASWTEEDEQQELGRLYRERGWGESFVLSGWRMRRVALFVFDIVVWMWLRYYLDFYLDVQAMYIFWQHSNFWFLLGNFGGIVLGLLWTAVEFYKILRDGEREDYLPGGQVLIVGLLIPMAGMHVTYLSVLSLFTGDKHRFLFISTLAESVLESSVSAFVQTYAVVFSTLSLADKVDLYSSIALSFISIGYAFSSLDKYDGGELLVKLPGLCRSSSAKWWAVFIFRISEVTSRATSLALFQCIWSWGIVSVMAADTVIVVVLSAIFQWSRGRKYGQTGQKLMRDNLVYALPSSICLMTPMLEKDSPMTLPPEMYYSLRVLELAGMVALAGWKIRWDVDVAREEFKDDAIIVVSFALSTVLMVLLCVVLRQFVAVRTLLEAPMDMWHMRPFNVTQQVLRNRILGADSADTCSKSRSGHTWHSEQRRIVAQIQRAPQRASSLIYADLASGLPKDMAKAEWDARFLSAKVTCCLEQSLQSLADTFASLQSGSKVFASRSSSFTRTPSKKKTLQHSNMSPQNSVVPALDHGVLRAGTLVHIRGPGGGLTNDESRVVMRWAGDSVDQKFVVESADEECVGFRGKLSEPILSGGHVRLRALQTNRMLGLAPLHHSNSALPLLDEEGGQALMESWDLETRKYSRPGSGVEPDTLFSFMLWREEEYRSARRFALSVKPLNKGTLEVGSFRPNVCGTDDFVESGWRIAAINGHAATPDDVEQILAQARQELEEDGVSENPESHLARSNTVGAHVLAARSDSMTSGKSRSSTAKFRVCFEKAYGNDMAIHLGDRVVLRAAAVPGGAAAGAGVGFGLEIGHGPSGLEPGSGTRALRVSADTDPLPLTVEPAEIGSRDDPPLYSWAAGEIRRKADAGRLSASLAEKCRVAIMVAFNARVTRSERVKLLGSPQRSACSRELHLRMLRLLSSLVRGFREIEVDFDGREEALEELRFCSGSVDESRPLVVQAVDAEDGLAATAGVQPGDEVVEAEVDRHGNRDSLHRTAKEIREVLGLGRGGRVPTIAVGQHSSSGTPRLVPTNPRENTVSPSLVLLFRSPLRNSFDSSGLQQVLVAQAGLVAQLMPSWEEIARPEDSSHRGDAPASRAAAAARLLRHHEFFRLKCSLGASLLQQGWELKYAGFADSALVIHQHLDALTRDALRARFPGTDDAAKQLREGLLAEQLDTLTASWASIPRAVKEQQPDALRKLFRHDVELIAMHDAIDAAFKAWTEQARDDSSLVEMPGALQRFVERVRPPHAVEAMSSIWVLRAWSGPEHQREYDSVQRVVSHFTEIYEATEQYWVHKLQGAATRMERTQEQLERALESADMRVALVPMATASEELKQIQALLSPDKLVLQGDLKLGNGEDAQVIPKGLKLVRRGQIFERFKSDVENADVHRRLLELATASSDGSDLRLLFGGDDYNRARAQAAVAIEELGAVIRVVKTAAVAFPETVALQCQELLGKHHKGELRAVTQENKRRIQIQEKEAEEMVRTANIKLMIAEDQKRLAEAKLREAEEERVMAEVAKNDAQKRADQWWDNLQVMAKEKDMLESDKGQLETEKLEWTKVQSLMELEKHELQADIERAKEERRRLEQEGEKWHQNLVTVKAQAEEKEAHLKEIHAILQRQQESAVAPSGLPGAEPSNFTVTQLLGVLSKAFQVDSSDSSSLAVAPTA